MRIIVQIKDKSQADNMKLAILFNVYAFQGTTHIYTCYNDHMKIVHWHSMLLTALQKIQISINQVRLFCVPNEIPSIFVFNFILFVLLVLFML